VTPSFGNRGGRLAADLTWPKLRQRWTRSGTAPGDRLTPAERDAIWEHAARAADDATARIRLLAGNDPAAAADAAWAAGDTLHVAAAALGSRVLRQAADAYDRAARARSTRCARLLHCSSASRMRVQVRPAPADLGSARARPARIRPQRALMPRRTGMLPGWLPRVSPARPPMASGPSW